MNIELEHIINGCLVGKPHSIYVNVHIYICTEISEEVLILSSVLSVTEC